MSGIFIIELYMKDGSRPRFFFDVSAFEPVEGHGYATKQVGRICQRAGVEGCEMWQASAEDIERLGAQPLSKAPADVPRRSGAVRLPWLQTSG